MCECIVLIPFVLDGREGDNVKWGENEKLGENVKFGEYWRVSRKGERW